MEGILSKARLLLFLSFLFLASQARASIIEYDDHWRMRADEARAAALAAYHPEPLAVADSFNDEVHKTIGTLHAHDNDDDDDDEGLHHHQHGNSTLPSARRGLRRRYTGKCLATNPIDRCWRCRKNWMRHRKRLARCGKGFGRNAIGGLDGAFYVVTDPSDDDLKEPRPGTLRYGVLRPEPLWIVFARDMVIRLSEELIVASYKTIDGRGANVHITGGAQITVQFVHNVIIHGLHIHNIQRSPGGADMRDTPTHVGLRGPSDGDGISIFGSSNVWIDHVSMSECSDGLIDAINASTAITISNCHFTKHNDVILLGADDRNSLDTIMQVTLAFNHFGRGLIQRMPRCRWGFFHVVNNDYTHWQMYAVGGSSHATIISQGNRYVANPRNISTRQVTHRETNTSEWKGWTWKSEGDLFQNQAFFIQSGPPLARKFSSSDMIKYKPSSFVTRLTRFSGALNCRENKPC